MVTADTSTAKEDNSEFCVTVGPVTKTDDIVTYLVKGAGC